MTRPPKVEIKFIIKRLADVYDRMASDNEPDNGNLSGVHAAILNLNSVLKVLPDG